MMLASPLLPSAPFSPKVASGPEDALSFRPARDVDAFNSLLPPPIEFVEGSSSGALAVPEGKYQPINVSPKPATKDRPDVSSPLAKPTLSPVVSAPNGAAPSPPSPSTPLGAKRTVVQPTALGIDLSWPETCDRASGLYNTGNTCFLNSALQCLLHTPPLLRVVIAHGRDKCRAAEKFCMVCAFRQVVVQGHKSSSPFAPSVVTSRLQVIAKHMKKGRQEDSHEFLRYAIDALQKSCLNGTSPKLEAKLAETTWVHKIFGGKLRSRVHCKSCGHNSDTFDRILDLSIDILKSDSLKEALRGFIAPDYLKGADKYKCEKCKMHVNAEKRFTIHDAPSVLTVHLKRFSPLGRKIGHHVTYDETLNLQPYMSKDQFGPIYSLYGVICHAGGGPNSGHYYAFVKSRTGRWYEMNDETVTPVGGAPVNRKMAYILFYMRNKRQGLQAALKASLNGSGDAEGEGRNERANLVAGMKKRREREEEEEEEEDVGEKVKLSDPASSPSKFIGPLLPSPIAKSEDTPDAKRVKVQHSPGGADKSDPQADKIKQKINAATQAKAKKALAVLESYDSDPSSGEERRKDKGKGKEKGEKSKESEDDDSDDDEGGKASRSSPPLQPPQSSPVSPTKFYGVVKKANQASNGVRPFSNLNHSDSSSDSDKDDRTQGTSSSSRNKELQKGKKHERAKLGMSMKAKPKGYVNPFSKIGSENALRNGGFSMNSANGGGGGGKVQTYGRRKNFRPRGL